MRSDLRARIRRLVQRALTSQGYQLQRVTPFDLRDSEESPRDLMLKYASPLRRSLLIEVPISRCRSMIGRALDERHPFVATLKEGPPYSYSGSVLEAYYRQFQPTSVAEALGVSEEQAPGFAELPADAFVFPWQAEDPMARREGRRGWVENHAINYGYELSASDGIGSFGPASVGKGDLEVERLSRLYHSMTQSGFLRSDGPDGDVTGRFLMDEIGNWYVEVKSGQHRIAVAAALDIPAVPVRITLPPVKREEVGYWFQVRAGRITREGALAVFDRIMAGDPPPSCQFARSERFATEYP
jgi:hypothetical protein